MRLEPCFAKLKKEQRSGLIAYMMAGDQSIDYSTKLLQQLPTHGVDVIELGMPFSDPVADGPVIEQAARRVLKVGITLEDICHMVESFRQHDDTTPIVLMGYYNPICHKGHEAFISRVKRAGVDGILVVDLPTEEDEELLQCCDKHGISLIKLVTPTTNDQRLKTIVKKARGFIYYVSVAGVTGAASGTKASIEAAVIRIKKHTDLPIAVGFGIKTAEDVTKIGSVSDAVVVGSAIVDRVAKGQSVEDVSVFVQSLASK